MRLPRQMRDDISTVRLRREFLIVKKDPDVWRATDDDGFYAPEIPASERACHDDQQNDHHRAECAAARLRWRIVAGRGINRRGDLWRRWWHRLRSGIFRRSYGWRV